MAFLIDTQYADPHPIPFSEQDLLLWVTTALEPFKTNAELTLRFVDNDEMSELNSTYRQKQGPTNVLSFPSDIPEEIAEEMDEPFLGDIIISQAVLLQESETLGIPLKAHWAHIVIHGVLHLLGYDHMEEHEEAEMQAIEIQLLKKIGYENPYLT